MTVRTRESRLPAGFGIDDLGEAVVVTALDGSPANALAGTLQAPLPVGFEIDDVVFVLNGANVVAYEWSVETVGVGAVEDGNFGRYTEWAVREFQMCAPNGLDRVIMGWVGHADPHGFAGCRAWGGCPVGGHW